MTYSLKGIRTAGEAELRLVLDGAAGARLAGGERVGFSGIQPIDTEARPVVTAVDTGRRYLVTYIGLLSYAEGGDHAHHGGPCPQRSHPRLAGTCTSLERSPGHGLIRRRYWGRPRPNRWWTAH